MRRRTDMVTIGPPWRRAGVLAALLLGGAGLCAEPARAAELAWPATTAAPIPTRFATADVVLVEDQLDQDDQDGHLDVYRQYRLQTEHGAAMLKLGFAWSPDAQAIETLRVRVTGADGTVTVLENPPLRAQSREQTAVVRYEQVELPPLSRGMAVEFLYRLRDRALRKWSLNRRWDIGGPLPILHLHYQREPQAGRPVSYWTPFGLPPGTTPPRISRSQRIDIEAHDIDPVAGSAPWPLETGPQHSVQIEYDDVAVSRAASPAVYWKRFVADKLDDLDHALDLPYLKRTAEQLAPGVSDARARVQRFYLYACSLGSLGSHGGTPTVAEDLRQRRNTADTIAGGAGTVLERNRVLLGLLRASGIRADEVWAAARWSSFRQDVPEHRGLDQPLVRVELDGETLWLTTMGDDHRFGGLPASWLGGQGIVIGRGEPQWVSLPVPPPDASEIHRYAQLHRDSAGVLRGSVTTVLTGPAADALRDGDDVTPAQAAGPTLDALLAALPSGSQATLTRDATRYGSDDPLVVTAEISIPAGANPLDLPVGLFGRREGAALRDEADVEPHPVYFRYPVRVTDEIRIDFDGLARLSALPATQSLDCGAARYSVSATPVDGGVTITRTLEVSSLLVPARYYPTVKTFLTT